MLLETAFIVEDLVAQIDVFHFASEEEPKEEVIDPSHQEGQECADPKKEFQQIISKGIIPKPVC